MRRRLTIGVALIGVTLLAGAGLLAQEEQAPSSKIGVVQFYTIEAEAPQFATARAEIRALETRASTVYEARETYSMLEPQECEQALAIELVPPPDRTRDQRQQLRDLTDRNYQLKAEYLEILQLRPSERTPQTDARADELRALNERCEAHWREVSQALETELEQANLLLQEELTDEFEAAVAKVAEARGLEMVVQHSIRTMGSQLDTGLPVVEFHRVVHYSTGPDVTDDVLGELNRRNADELGLTGPE
ncbi:MAG: hypothetical protein GF320_08405 [Armatimonadia bacterium]|nr:hypothetical protein [Armatimonadia bacterium]